MRGFQPVSFAQQRLWFLDQLEPGSSAYNLPNAIRIRGILDVGNLRLALEAIVQRQDSLRTTFATVDGEVKATITASPDPLELPVVNLEHLPEYQKEEHALREAAEDGLGLFDLSAGPLLRAKLLRLSPSEHILVLTFHHIIMDGWSMNVFLKELAEFYLAFCSRRSPRLPPLPIQYSDFAIWQRESGDHEVEAREIEFWKRTLSGAPAVLELPADRRRPPVASHRGRRHVVRLDAELSKSVSELCRKEGVTPFMTLLSTFETLLWRYTGVTDFVLGTPMAGRSHVEVEHLIGLFVNTIPLRANLDGNPTFRALLHRVREATLDAIANQQVPFEKLVEELRPERSMSHAPLFQVMFILHNNPRTSLEFAGLSLEELEFDTGVAKFDLTLEVFDLGGLTCIWEYGTDLYDHQRIVRMTGHFETLLREICANPDRRLSELPILSVEEWNKVVLEWNATESNYPRDLSIHNAFEVQAEGLGSTLAVRGENRQLTFEQLNDQANRLAHYLIGCGVQPLDRVAVVLERSVNAIAALLAVLKTGASYVPIDPSYPRARIELMLTDCGARVLITQYGLRERLPEQACQTVFIDRDRGLIAEESRLNPNVKVASTDPAYVIYTSGSTGNPKGVLGTHRASINRFAWMWKTYPFGPGEACAQRTSLSFVDSICEIFGPLLQGVAIVVMPDETVVDSSHFVNQLAAQSVTRLVVVPSQLAFLIEACQDLETALPSLRLCFTSGEELPFHLYQRFKVQFPNAALVNLYGSSEVAADVTCFDASAANLHDFVPIGKPIANVRAYLLDPYLNPVPTGVAGEIYVGGDCLAIGYLNRPELDAERFVADPFIAGERLYKTGDLGRYDENGNIEFLGRRDNQVKLSGHRIELGEIESALRADETIRNAVVLLGQERAGRRPLIAYVIPAEGKEVIHSELRRQLKAKLPDYMVPSKFVTLAALPINPNGKLDLQALRVLDVAQSQAPHSYMAPRNRMEQDLVQIWAELLKIGSIGVFDNFFELGGHSLMASQVIARIRKYMGIEASVRNLFDAPTVASLASVLGSARVSGVTARDVIVPKRIEPQSRERLAARLSELSDEEIDALLNTALLNREQTGRSAS